MTQGIDPYFPVAQPPQYGLSAADLRAEEAAEQERLRESEKPREQEALPAPPLEEGLAHRVDVTI